MRGWSRRWMALVLAVIVCGALAVWIWRVKVDHHSTTGAPVISGSPERADLAWTPDMNHHGAATVTHVGAADARELASAINAAPRWAPGTYNCAMDDGSKVVVTFTVRDHSPETDPIMLSGCAGPEGRMMTDRLQADLKRLEPAGFHE